MLKQQRKEARTGFYYFLKEQRDKLAADHPQLKQIEVIAFLQAKWTALSHEEKLAFEMTDTQPKVTLNLDKQGDCLKVPKQQKEVP